MKKSFLFSFCLLFVTSVSFPLFAQSETCEEMHAKTYNDVVESTSTSKLKNQFHQYGIKTLSDLRRVAEDHSKGGSAEIDSVWANVKGSYYRADGTLNETALQQKEVFENSGEVSSEISTAFRSSKSSETAANVYGLCIANRTKAFDIDSLKDIDLSSRREFNITIKNNMFRADLPFTVASQTDSLSIIGDDGKLVNALDGTIPGGAIKSVKIKRTGNASGKILVFPNAFPAEPVPIIVPEFLQYNTSVLIPNDLVEVNARTEWNSTGFSVKSGDIIRVQYISDKWNWGPRDEGYVGITGYNESSMKHPPVPGIKQSLVLPSAPVASLVAKVSDSAYTNSENSFWIVNGQDYKVSSPGKLYFAMNDVPNNYADNDGLITVKLIITRKQSQ